jgi:hypothetical protein
MPCRIARVSQWKLRLLHELNSWEQSLFLNLTYSPDFLPAGGTLVKADLQKFFKRLRKSLGDSRIKYFACGEYGDESFRPHYHAIVFGWWPIDAYVWRRNKDILYYRSSVLERLWPFGNSEFGIVNGKDISYVAGYIEKKIYGKLEQEGFYGDRLPPFQVQSRGLGLDYALQHKEQFDYQLSTTLEGKKVCLPRYYVKKLDIDTTRLSELSAKNSDERQRKASRLLSEKDIEERYFEFLKFHQIDLKRRNCDLEAIHDINVNRKKI